MKTLRQEVEEILEKMDFSEMDAEEAGGIGVLPPNESEPNYNMGAAMRYITENNIKDGLTDEQMKMFIRS